MNPEIPQSPTGYTIRGQATLKARVKSIIDQHAGSYNNEPPFTAGEKIVMAIVLQELPSFTRLEALEAIILHFPYYKNKVVERYFSAMAGFDCLKIEDLRDDQRCIVPGFAEAFKSSDLPLAIHASQIHLGGFTIKNCRYTIPDSAARHYLRSYIEPPRRGPFPFLKLPVDLRYEVYKWVLKFSGPGIHVTQRNNVPRLEVCRPMDRDDLVYDRIEHRALYRRNPLIRRDDSTHVLISTKELAVSQVSKQLYEEAMGVFYGVNTFHVNDLATFRNSWINRLPPLAVSSIRQLIFSFSRLWGQNDYTEWQPICQILASMRLDWFALDLEDNTWLKMRKHDRQTHFSHTAPFKKVKDIPGFSDLASVAVRAERLRMCGDQSARFRMCGHQSACPKIKQYFDGEIKKAKAGPKESTMAIVRDVQAGEKRKRNVSCENETRAVDLADRGKV